jgi:hypothetical protein
MLRAEFKGMALAVKENVFFYPVGVSLFGPDAVMLEAYDGANLLKKSRHDEVTSTRKSIKHSRWQLAWGSEVV